MEPWDLPHPSGDATGDEAGGGDDRRRRAGDDEEAKGDLLSHPRTRRNNGISDIEDPSSSSSPSRGTGDANHPIGTTEGLLESSAHDGAMTSSSRHHRAGEVLQVVGGNSDDIAVASAATREALASLEAAALAMSIVKDRPPRGPPAASDATSGSGSSHHREKKKGDERRKSPSSHQELLRRQAAAATAAAAAAATSAASPTSPPSGAAALVPSWERRPPPQSQSRTPPVGSYGRSGAANGASTGGAARASSMPALGGAPSPSSSSTGGSPPHRHHVNHEQQQRRRQHAADSFDSDPYCAPPSSGAMTSSSNIPMPGWSVVETSTTSSTSPERQPSSSPTWRAQVQVPVVDEFGNELVAAAPLPPASPGGLPPCQRSLHSAAVLDGVMYVFGGYDGQARVNDFYGFSFGEMRWYPVVPAVTSGPPPSPRDRHISIAYRNTFYIFGGFDGRARVSDFYGFKVNSMTWQEIIHLSGSPPSPRHSHAAVVFNDSMYVFGGYDGSYRSDLNEFDFLTSSWKTVQASGRPPRARYRATCVVHNNLMVLFGGHDGTRHLADAHVFDFETRVWSGLVTEGVPPLPRDSHVSVMHGDSMYVFGGSTGSAMNDLHELRFPSGGGDSHVARWSPIMSASDANIPRHRFCHVGVVYCDSMFVFGGYDGSSRLNDFIRFDFGVGNTTCEVQPSSLISDLRSFVNNEELSDITFIVEGQHVHAHKFMLVRSSYFRAMFLGEMREATQPTIPLEHVSLPVFLLLLEYLYTDEVTVSLDFAMELFAAADEFCVPRLKAICEKEMLSSITVENAASLFLAADLHSADSLKRKTLNFILGNFEQVSKTSTFEEMARTNVELVFEILRNR